MPETKQYGIIYADPPWHYDRKHGSGVAENHYPTMSIEEICALPVSEKTVPFFCGRPSRSSMKPSG